MVRRRIESRHPILITLHWDRLLTHLDIFAHIRATVGHMGAQLGGMDQLVEILSSPLLSSTFLHSSWLCSTLFESSSWWVVWSGLVWSGLVWSLCSLPLTHWSNLPTRMAIRSRGELSILDDGRTISRLRGWLICCCWWVGISRVHHASFELDPDQRLEGREREKEREGEGEK